jgi:hypothetical protein
MCFARVLEIKSHRDDVIMGVESSSAVRIVERIEPCLPQAATINSEHGEEVRMLVRAMVRTTAH